MFVDYGADSPRHGGYERRRDRLVARASREVSLLTPSPRGAAEKAHGAYKDLSAVVEAAEKSGLSLRLAKLEPLTLHQRVRKWPPRCRLG